MSPDLPSMPHSILQTAAAFNRLCHKVPSSSPGEHGYFEGSRLIPEGNSPFEPLLSRSFEGQTQSFRSAGRHLVVRTSNRGTRRLRPSEAAFREEGYEVSGIIISHEDWRGYYATRGVETLHVRERMSEPSTGRTWNSLSTWFWHATLFPKAGPWELVSVITPLEKR